MDEYEKLMKKLLQTKFELDTGIYKRKSNKQILEDFNDQLEKMKKIEMNKNQYSIINNTCTTDCKVGKTQKSFNNDMKPITINYNMKIYQFLKNINKKGLLPANNMKIDTSLLN